MFDSCFATLGPDQEILSTSVRISMQCQYRNSARCPRGVEGVDQTVIHLGTESAGLHHSFTSLRFVRYYCLLPGNWAGGQSDRGVGTLCQVPKGRMSQKP